MVQNMKKKGKLIIFTLVTIILLFITSFNAMGNNIEQTEYMNEQSYGGQLRVYIVEPTSRWDNYDKDPYHFGFLDFAIDETLSINYLETYTTQVVWDASEAGYSNVKENNIMAIAAVFNHDSIEKYAYPPSKNPFDAHYVDAAAAAKPGETGENFRNETITHTVFCEEATATWCQYCPAAANGLYDVYDSEEYPFYFAAMVADKNDIASDRVLEDYNLYGYPTCFFDGGYSVVVGASSESTYKSKVRVRSAKDVHELDLSITVEWLGDGDLQIGISITNNEQMPNSPPDIPTITGPLNGKINTEYTYRVVTNDPDGDDVYYCIDWGDGTDEVCIGPYTSDEEAIITHTWTEKNTYTLRVKAKDANDAESDWATLQLSMSKLKGMSHIFSSKLFDYLTSLRYILRNIIL